MTENFLNIMCIRKDATVKEAMRKIGENTGRVLYILEDGGLLGSLSDGDIRKWILNEGKLSESVEKVCYKKPIFLNESYQMESVKQIMLRNKIESIPVLNSARKIVDILLWDDVFSGKKTRKKGKLDAQVVIMAGGKGERLHPFTTILPKPLIPVQGKPIIEIIIDRFKEFSVKEFHICLNYKSKMVKSYFEDKDMKYSYIFEQKPLGTAGALKLLQGRLKSPFILTNCDIIIDSDYKDLIQFHQDHRNALTLVVSYRHYVIPYGVCEINNGGTLKSMHEKPEYDLLVNTGMYVLNADLLKLIPRNQNFNMTDLIEKARKRKLRIGIFPIRDKSWIDIGQWEEYHKAIDQLRV